MLLIEIEKEYECPEEWCDITLSKYVGSCALVEKMPKKLYEKIFDKKEVEATSEEEIEIAQFYKEWVSFMCDIPKDIAGRLPVYVENGFGIFNLFNITSKFMFMPSDIKPQELIEHEGRAYKLAESLSDLNGNSIPMGGSSFDEFYEAAELKRVQQDLKNGNATILPLLTAILYRPAKKVRSWFKYKFVTEPYDSASVKKRAEKFRSLPMDKVWGAYFFFIQSRLTLLKSTLTSLEKERELQAKTLADSDGTLRKKTSQRMAFLTWPDALRYAV